MGNTWNSIAKCLLFSTSSARYCWISNWDLKGFLLSRVWSQVSIDLNLEMKTYNILWWLPKIGPMMFVSIVCGRQGVYFHFLEPWGKLARGEWNFNRKGKFFFWECIATITFWRMRAELIFLFFIISNLFGLYNTFGRTCIFISLLFNQFVINVYNVVNSFFFFFFRDLNCYWQVMMPKTKIN